jgi:hypothetical protein
VRVHEEHAAHSIRRASGDQGEVLVAKAFYENLFENEVIEPDALPYALHYAVMTLRAGGLPVQRWGPFVHVGV